MKFTAERERHDGAGMRVASEKQGRQLIVRLFVQDHTGRFPKLADMTPELEADAKAVASFLTRRYKKRTTA